MARYILCYVCVAGPERLLDLLEKRVSSILDARVQWLGVKFRNFGAFLMHFSHLKFPRFDAFLRTEKSVAQLRRGCAARGIAFDWRPALSSQGGTMMTYDLVDQIKLSPIIIVM